MTNRSNKKNKRPNSKKISKSNQSTLIVADSPKKSYQSAHLPPQAPKTTQQVRSPIPCPNLLEEFLDEELKNFEPEEREKWRKYFGMQLIKDLIEKGVQPQHPLKPIYLLDSDEATLQWLTSEFMPNLYDSFYPGWREKLALRKGGSI